MLDAASDGKSCRVSASCSPSVNQEAYLVSVPAVLPALPKGKTEAWGEFEQILNPEPRTVVEQGSLPEDYCCPITSRLMREPVTTSDGHTYEREAIEKWLKDHNTSPSAGSKPLESKKLTPVLFVKNAVGKLLDRHPELKDSKEWYLPESWVKELARACERGDEAAIRELVGRDRRLLVHTFEDTHLGGKTALQLAVAASTHNNNNNKALFVVVELLEQRKRGLALAALLQEDSKRKGHVALHQAILARRDCGTLLQIMSWMGKSLDLVSAPPDWPLLAQNNQISTTRREKKQIQNTLNALLLWSVVHGDPVKVACLLRLRASPDVLNSEGQSVLYVAVMQQASNLPCNREVAQGGEAKGAEPEQRETLLLRGQVIQLLLQEGANPNALNADGKHSPLHLALEKDSLATALELIHAGHASLDLRLVDGMSPLHVVAGKATTELADALWGGDRENIGGRSKSPKKRARGNAPHNFLPSELETTCGSEAHTPLHCAAKSGSVAMLHWLVNRGAQLVAVNAKQQNLLHMAASHNHTQFVAEAAKLLAVTAPGHTLHASVDCDGNTPLHLAAAQSGASDMVRRLLTELETLPPSRNRAGQLPRQVAESLGHMAVLKTYDDTVAMLRAKDEAVLAQQQGPLGELLLKLHRVIETQQTRLEQQEGVIERQQVRLEQQEDAIERQQGRSKRQDDKIECQHVRVKFQELQLQKLEHETRENVLTRGKEFLEIRDFLKPQMETDTFLRHVVAGDYKAVEVIIEKNPDVLFRRGHVTDWSKRTFDGITGYQYATWALDLRMLRIVLKHLPKSIAHAQGSGFYPWYYFDLGDIGRAYDSCQASQQSLERIAREQRLLPVHVLRELAEPNFHNATFNSAEPFTTERSFQQWYEASSNTMWVHCEDGTLRELSSLSPEHLPAIMLDRKAIESLMEKRQSQQRHL